jgi:hypothetical protein
VQETLEGAGALAGGGWIGFALAFPGGLLVALGIRGADVAEVRIAGALLRAHALGRSAIGIRSESPAARVAVTGFGARAPPQSCVV